MTSQRCADRLVGIVEFLIPPVEQQPLHHRVVPTDELQDHLGAELCKPGDEFVQWNVAADRLAPEASAGLSERVSVP